MLVVTLVLAAVGFGLLVIAMFLAGMNYGIGTSRPQP